ncbi:MAG: sensor histidine kinase [Patescibacteria group bacterium]|jgi:signal transduction histidine kinase
MNLVVLILVILSFILSLVVIILLRFRIRAKRCLFNLSKLAEAGKLSLEVYHDLANIVSLVNLTLDQIENPQELSDSLSEISHRANLLLQSFKNQCRDGGEKQKFNVLSEIKSSLLILNCVLIKNKVKLELLVDENIEIVANPIRFGQLMINLLNNAIEAFPDHQKNKLISISSQVRDNSVSLIIKDSGGGIPACVLKNIFKPFFSSKTRSKENCGLGLSIAKKIVEDEFLGKIKIKTCLGQGTTFIIEIPFSKI